MSNDQAVASDSTPMSVPSKKSKIKFVKTPSFRAIHVDGAFGGLTPNGHIAIALFSERNAIPDSVELTISPDGKTTETRYGGLSVIREIDVNATMTVDTARSIHEWLGKQLQLADRLKAMVESGQAKLETIEPDSTIYAK